SGACPRWNIFAAFLTPGMIRIQVSRMPDGEVFFCLARTIQKDSGGYHAQQPVMAIGLGCKVEFAKELVYSDGVDLENPGICTPVGVTCRTCERTDCDQRAFPSMRQPLVVDENVRGTSLYAVTTKYSSLRWIAARGEPRAADARAQLHPAFVAREVAAVARELGPLCLAPRLPASTRLGPLVGSFVV